MSRRSSILPAVIAAALLLGAIPAGASPRLPRQASGEFPEAAPRAQAPTPRAFSLSRQDGNDTRGPLDLSSMKLTRGKKQDTISFTTIESVPNAAIDPNNGNFAILIDNNDNRKFDFAQYVFFAGGKIRGLLYNLRTDHTIDRTVPTSRTGPKAFRQVIERTRLQSPGTYRIALFAVYGASPCAQTCQDAIPNRFPLIPLDHRAPTASWDSAPPLSGDASSDLSAPIEFHFADDHFGTGVEFWTVERREMGSATWELVEQGTAVSPTVAVPGEEGKTYNVRFTVTDKQENRSVSSTKRITFPSDDDNGVIYNPVATQDVAATNWFLGTRTGISNALAPGTATFSFTGSAGTQVCVMGGPVASGTATADVTLDGFADVPMVEDVSVLLRSSLHCYSTNNDDPHTLVVTGTSASTFWIDGFYVVP